jgi:hypothetical protein
MNCTERPDWQNNFAGKEQAVRTQAHHIILQKPLSAFSRKTQYEPMDCGSCKRRLWSHGCRDRNLENRKITLKRLRCPTCRKVVSIRPEGMCDYFQSLVSTIFQTLLFRFSERCWPRHVTRQRAGHWLRAFQRFFRFENPSADPLEFLLLTKSRGGNYFIRALRY